MWPLQPSSTSWDNSGVIIGSHVFLITEAQIRGRGAVLAVCLPTSSSDVASNWTLIGANPFTTHTPFPTSTTNHFPHQSWFLYHLSLYPVSSWIMQIQCENIPTWPTYNSKSSQYFILENVLLLLNRKHSCLLLQRTTVWCFCCFGSVIFVWPPQGFLFLISPPRGNSRSDTQHCVTN